MRFEKGEEDGHREDTPRDSAKKGPLGAEHHIIALAVRARRQPNCSRLSAHKQQTKEPPRLARRLVLLNSAIKADEHR